MSTVVLTPLSQIQLSPDSVIKVSDLSWTDYQTLLREWGDHRVVQVTYVQGVLEVRMPSKQHEMINRFLERMITTLTEELGMSVISLGSTTFDRETFRQGVEPDSCFYIQNATRIDVEAAVPPVDLPPDLVVEVDIYSSSKSRLQIYAEMGVPEIWHYRHQNFVILQLHNHDYVECDRSLAFPQVSTHFLKQLVERGIKSKNQNTIILALRHEINSLK